MKTAVAATTNESTPANEPAPGPFADSRIAKFLRKRIDELASVKTQRQIAQEAGFATPNIMSMMKKGNAKVPLDRVVALARALNSDPRHLFQLTLEQYDFTGKADDEATKVLMTDVMSDNERDIITFIREINENNPGLNDQRRAALKELFSA